MELYAKYQKSGGAIQDAKWLLFPLISHWPMSAEPGDILKAFTHYHAPIAINRLFLSQIIGNNFKLTKNGFETSMHMILVAMPDVFGTLSGRQMLVEVAAQATVPVGLKHVHAQNKGFCEYLATPSFAEGMLKLQEMARESFGYDAETDTITVAEAEQYIC